MDEERAKALLMEAETIYAYVTIVRSAPAAAPLCIIRNLPAKVPVREDIMYRVHYAEKCHMGYKKTLAEVDTYNT